MLVCIPYMVDDNLHEGFLAFVEVTNRLSKMSSGTPIEEGCWNCLHIWPWIWQGSKYVWSHGVHAVVQDKHPAALHMHCTSHSLNLVLCHSGSVPEIQNAFGDFQEICAFFGNSALRSVSLNQKNGEPHDSMPTLSSLASLLCRRWKRCKTKLGVKCLLGRTSY